MSVVQYYNTAAMYRHPQAMTAAVAAAAHHQNAAQFYPNTPMHGWYAGGYHGQPSQMAQTSTPTYCMQEEQQMSAAAWHHANQHSFQQEFQEFFSHPNFQTQQNSCQNENSGLPSPPITVSGSEMSSPGVDGSSPNQTNHPRPPQVRSPYEWIKKNSYQNQPLPDKKKLTRTRDKYRSVYTEYQRSELEKEFILNNKYIKIKRKLELAFALGLSERQVKIWFQNRRAKERKLIKKCMEEVSCVRPEELVNNPIKMAEFERLLRAQRELQAPIFKQEPEFYDNRENA